MPRMRLSEDGDEPPPPPPPRRIRPVLTLDALDLALQFCDLRTVGRAMLVCKHWRDRCNVSNLWERFALAGNASGAASVSSTKFAACDVSILKKFAKRAFLENATAMNVRTVAGNSSDTDAETPSNICPGEVAGSVGKGVPFSRAIEGHNAAAAALGGDPRRVALWSAPPLTVVQEVDAAASAFFAAGDRLPSEGITPSTQLQWLEIQERILQRRAARVAACVSELVASSAGQRQRLQPLMADAHKQALDIEQLAVDGAVWTQAAENATRRMEEQRRLTNFCCKARRLLQLFESVVVKSLLAAYFGRGEQDPVDTARGAVPHIATFVDLETLVLSGRNLSSPLGLQWGRFKRLFPVDETYFDLKDWVLDEEDSCERLLAEKGTTKHDDNEHAALVSQQWNAVQRLLATVDEERCALLCETQQKTTKCVGLLQPEELFSHCRIDT